VYSVGSRRGALTEGPSGYVQQVMEAPIRSLAACLAAGLISLGVAAGCGDDNGSDTVAQKTATQGAPLTPEQDEPLSAAEVHGRELFIERCGSCHTLDAAGTVGQIGPNLGDISVTEADVRRAIMIGGRGSGNMPQNLVTGKDARDVAAFVAANAGGSSTP
jgi:mono/diheme cytochrome c family protein